MHFIDALNVLELRDFSRYIECRDPGQAITILPPRNHNAEEFGMNQVPAVR
jgi:hypothetical protein